MVVYNLNKLKAIYKDIQQRSTQNANSTILFCNADADALCALKMLQSQLDKDYIHYTLVPVNSPCSLKKAANRYLEGSNLKTMIFLNCGGLLDLHDMFPDLNNRIIYVFDSQLPYNLKNMFSSSKIKIVCEEDKNAEELYEAYQMVELGKFDIDYDFDAQNNLPGVRHLEDDDPVKAATISLEVNKLKRKLFKKSVRLIHDYQTGGVHHGLPISYIFYLLLEQCGSLTSEIFWWCSLGLTHHFVNKLISKERYSALANELTKNLKAFNTEHYGRKKRALQQSGRLANNKIQSLTGRSSLRGQHPFRSQSYSSGDGSIEGSDFSPKPIRYVSSDKALEMLKNGVANMTIEEKQPSIIELKLDYEGMVSSEEAFHFHSLHYWSLYEALYYSVDTSAHFEVWTEAGRKRLHYFLAKMGISLEQASKKYPHMNYYLKTELLQKFKELGPTYGLTNITYPSFSKNVGYYTILPLMASDAVNSLQALLNLNPTILTHLMDINTSRTSRYDINSSFNTIRVIDDETEHRMTPDELNLILKPFCTFYTDECNYDPIALQEATLYGAFYTAYDALGPKGIELLKSGISLDRYQYKEIMKTTFNVIRDSRMNLFETYALAYIKDGIDSDTLGNVRALRLMGNLLFKTIELQNASLPLILMAHTDSTDTFLIVGQHRINSSKEVFNLHFKRWEAKLEQYELRLDFNKQVLRLPEFELADFLKELRLVV